MEKTEIIIGDLKIVKVDRLNWQIFECREIKKQNNPNFKNREGETDWMALPVFFGTLKPALVKAKEIYRERKLPSGDLSTAIASIEKADADFCKLVDKALKAVKQ